MERKRLRDIDTTWHALVAQAVAAAVEWRRRKRAEPRDSISLILCGPTGVGKSHIAQALRWTRSRVAVYEDGTPIEGTERPEGKFFKGGDLLRRLPDAELGVLFGAVPRLADGQPVAGILPPLMVAIDDIGAEPDMKWVAAGRQPAELTARYFGAIDYCYENDISLVITSNLSPKALQALLGPRSVDRLWQMAPKGFRHNLAGVPSWRQRAVVDR